jgi:hypothetical protein
VKRAVAMTGLSGSVIEQILAEQRAGQRDYGDLLWMLMVLGAVNEMAAETSPEPGLHHIPDATPAGTS